MKHFNFLQETTGDESGGNLVGRAFSLKYCPGDELAGFALAWRL